MEAKNFAALLRSVQTLNRAQRQKLMGALEATASGDAAVALVNGTPMARLRRREAGLRFSQTMVDGLSVRKAAAAADIHRTTSFRWRHRMLAEAALLKDTELSGIVEAEETFFLESFKGSKAWAKAARGGQPRTCRTTWAGAGCSTVTATTSQLTSSCSRRCRRR